MLQRDLCAFVLVLAVPHADAQVFVVANRGAANITVHAAADGERLLVVPLPAGTETPEPMYVQSVGDEVLVGDRANDLVVRFSRDDYSVKGTIPVGEGVFHMWAGEEQLWVNNDVDNTASVIDIDSMSVVATIPMPADLVAQGYRPHDVYVGKKFAWVSLLGGSGESDWVVQYDQKELVERDRVAVGGDPHLWLDRDLPRLYVASQESGEVATFHAVTMQPLGVLPVPGAHGVFQPASTRLLLTTNITGGGVGDLYALRTAKLGLAVEVQADTDAPTAHNIAAAPFGAHVMVTHSGAQSNAVTLYAVDVAGPAWLPFGDVELIKVGEAVADTNPFGLAFVP